MNPLPFQYLLSDKLKCSQEIIDSSFEFCLFRDCFVHFRKNHHPSQEKQTFDNVFLLQGGTLILVEGKAHQTFSTKQVRNLMKAKADILADSIEFKGQKIRDVKLIGLHSSKYTPKNREVLDAFDAKLTWSELAKLYPSPEWPFQRADEIYNDRASRRKQRQNLDNAHVPDQAC